MHKLVQRSWPPAIIAFGVIATLAWVGFFSFGLFKLAELML